MSKLREFKVGDKVWVQHPHVANKGLVKGEVVSVNNDGRGLPTYVVKFTDITWNFSNHLAPREDKDE